MTERETLKTLLQEALHVGTLLNNLEPPELRKAARDRFLDVVDDEVFWHAQTERGESLILDAVFGSNDGRSVRAQTPDQLRRRREYEEWKAGVPS